MRSIPETRSFVVTTELATIRPCLYRLIRNHVVTPSLAERVDLSNKTTIVTFIIRFVTFIPHAKKITN